MLAIPATAVQTVNGQASVFVSEADGQFRVRPVEVGAERDGLAEVTRGLQAGDRVVTAGAFILKSELLEAPDGGE